MLKERRILVTGSDGFVGRHLCAKLKNLGGSVYGIDKKSDIDLSSKPNLNRYKRIDTVFHLAAVMRTSGAKNEDRAMYRNNIEGIRAILNFCKDHDTKLIFVSSYLYGDPDYLPIDEDHPLKPHNIYGRSKLDSEILCKQYHEDYGVCVTILRPFNIYGPGQQGDFVIPVICRQAKDSARIILEGSNEKRDFLYIDDMVAACVRAATYKGSGYDVFNIGSGKSISIRDVVKAVTYAYGRKNVPLNFLEKCMGTSPKDTVADIRKAKKQLYWTPRISFKEGVRRMVGCAAHE